MRATATKSASEMSYGGNGSLWPWLGLAGNKLGIRDERREEKERNISVLLIMVHDCNFLKN